MCVALPGKVVNIEGKNAVVDFNGNRVKARLGLTPVQIGDFVLVHAGCVLQVMDQAEAESMIELFGELEAAAAQSDRRENAG